MLFTYIIIGITCLISFLAFSNHDLLYKLIFNPTAIRQGPKEWHRFISCGFIHADIAHLAFNMYSFYMFGQAIETAFDILFGSMGKWLFILMYFSALVVCLLPTYKQHYNNPNYYSLGASGAVSAIVFAFIFLAPVEKIGLMLIPGLYAPAFIFGAIYLGVSAYLAKRGQGGINHSAHFWGAIYGIAFVIVFTIFFSHFNALQNFIFQIRNYFT